MSNDFFLKNIINSGLVKSSGVYTVSSFINAGVPFLLIPFLTRYLSPEDYGIVSMATILINIVAPLIGFSAHGAVQRKYFEVKAKVFARYIGNAFFILILSSIVLLLVFYIFNSSLSKLTEIPSKWLYVVIFIAINQFFTLILLTVWQAQIKPFHYGILQVTQSFLNLGLTILLIGLLNQGWEGRIFAQLIAVLSGAIFAIIFMMQKKMIIFQFDINDIKDILKFSVPLIPHTLGGLMIAFTDRLLITNLISVSETGIYTVAYQVGSILGILTASFNSAYIPWLYLKLSNADKKEKIKIVKITYIYFLGLVVIAFLSIFILPWVISLIAGKSYQGASEYTIWIVVGYVFNGMYLMVSAYLFYTKKTGVLAIITFSSAMLNIPLSYYLIIQYGTIGAAFSMSMVFFISFILTWFYSSKSYPMPWFSFR